MQDLKRELQTPGTELVSYEVSASLKASSESEYVVLQSDSQLALARQTLSWYA